jgi:hypothetical protein
VRRELEQAQQRHEELRAAVAEAGTLLVEITKEPERADLADDLLKVAQEIDVEAALEMLGDP